MAPISARSGCNLLFNAIAENGGSDFRLHAKTVHIEAGTVLCNAGDRMRHAVFPVSCVLATVATLSDGSTLEVNVIGREAAHGLLAGVGSGEVAARVVALVGGTAERTPMRLVRNEFERSACVRAVMVRHFENMLFQMQQSAVCAARHSVEERLCRWLLTIRDRSASDTLRFTHEFAAGHLGANRSSVTLAAAALQKAGLIAYRRGALTICDRPGLEEAVCECYGTIRDRLHRLFA